MDLIASSSCEVRWGHTSGTELLSTFLDSRHVHELLVSVFVFCLYQMMFFQRWTIVPTSYAHLKAFYYLWLRSLSPFLLSSPLFLSSLSVSSSYYPEPLSCNLIWRQVLYLKQHSVKCTLMKGHGTSTQERQRHRQEWLKREDVQILCFWLSEVRMSSCWFRAGTSRMWVDKFTV